jgi:hypothetical protein
MLESYFRTPSYRTHVREITRTMKNTPYVTGYRDASGLPCMARGVPPKGGQRGAQPPFTCPKRVLCPMYNYDALPYDVLSPSPPYPCEAYYGSPLYPSTS